MLSGGLIYIDRYKEEGDKFRVSFALGGVVRIASASKLYVKGGREFFSINSILKAVLGICKSVGDCF